MPSTAAKNPRFPGPDALGRGVVIGPGTPPPEGFASAPQVVVDDEVMQAPGHVAAFLHHRWLRRERVVIVLAVESATLREPEVSALPPYQLPSDHTFHRERLQFLVWANNYDARGGVPRWWHGILAARRGAAPAEGAGDVVLADGGPAWVDGGPRGPLATPLVGPDDLPLVHRESVGLGHLTVLGDAAPSEPLAPDQLAAVTHRAGPARVIAPAGSGKTRVLTARLRHLVSDRNVEPQLTTAVAYNTRAAAEMRSRTPDLGTSIRTLHSLALWICNLDERRDVIHERDVRGVLDQLIRTARIPNQDPFQPYLEALSEVRLALRDPADVELQRGDVDGFTDLFDRYRAELARRRVLDFDEQIYRAIELLLTRPDLRAVAQRAATHLLVDEFQDLTPAFLLLVRLVAGPSMQVFAVGDDDQTIYSYAGATPSYLVDFDRWFPGAQHHALEVNYRCPAPVVDAAVNLLSHNRVRVPKQIRSTHATSDPATCRPGRGRDVEVVTPVNPHEEPLTIHRVAGSAMADRTVSLVRERLDTGAAPGTVAVLARVNSALLPVQVAMTEAAIPTTAPLDATVLGRTGIRTALAYVRLGLDLDHIRREDVLDTINRPARKVKSAVVPLLRGNRFTIRQLSQVADGLDDTHQHRFVAYLDDLRHLGSVIADGGDMARCLWLVRNRIGLGEAMDALDASRTRPEGTSHGDDLDGLDQLAALHPHPASFRDWLVERLRVPRDPAGVMLSTVHRVKGMEWDHVVVFAANQGLFPHRLADDIEEERRVFHVAVTRCRQRVDVVADQERTSRFVGELATAAERGPGHDPWRRQRPAPPPAVEAEQAADGTVVARPGLDLVLAGGLVARVVEVAAEGTVALVGPAGLPGGVDSPAAVVARIPFGQPVRVAGRRTSLSPPLAPVGEPDRATGPAGTDRSRPATRVTDGTGAAGEADRNDPADEALFEALRAWRLEVATDTKVPPYLVFHDRHLRSVAARKPRSLRELAACPGVGPAKLERYGDDVLDVVDRHLASAGDAVPVDRRPPVPSELWPRSSAIRR